MARAYLGISCDLGLAAKVKELAETRKTSESKIVAEILERFFNDRDALKRTKQSASGRVATVRAEDQP